MDIKERVDWRADVGKAIAFEDYAVHTQEALERLKYQVDFSQAALKNLQLVNGGAMIALLTFIGNVEEGIDPNSVFWSFVWYSSGLAGALVSYFGAYLSQSNFMNVAFLQAWEAQHRARGSATKFPFDKEFKNGNRALYGAIGMAVLSTVCFVVGSFVEIEGFR